MCVFGELLYNSFFPGLICGLIFVSICFFNSNDKKKFTITVFLISILGYLFDTILVFFQIYSFETSLNALSELGKFENISLKKAFKDDSSNSIHLYISILNDED